MHHHRAASTFTPNRPESMRIWMNTKMIRWQLLDVPSCRIETVTRIRLPAFGTENVKPDS